MANLEKTKSSSSKKKSNKKQNPADEELAEIAKRASASVRTAGKGATGGDSMPYVDALDLPAEEHPLERSAIAYVATISPSVPGLSSDGDADDSDSLDLALDDFVKEARQWQAVLPAPVLDDKALANLGQVPPKQSVPAAAKPVGSPVTEPQADPQSDAKSPVGIALICLLLGGAIGFGAFKFLGGSEQPVKPVPAAKSEVAAVKTKATPAPAVIATKAAKADGAKAPVATAVESASNSADAAPTADAAAAAKATVAPDAAPVAKKAAPVTTAPPKAATTAAPAATPVAAKPVVAKPVVAKKKKRATRKRSTKRKTKKPKAASSKKKPAKKGGWVDPFSQ